MKVHVTTKSDNGYTLYLKAEDVTSAKAEIEEIYTRESDFFSARNASEGYTAVAKDQIEALELEA